MVKVYFSDVLTVYQRMMAWAKLHFASEFLQIAISPLKYLF